MRPYAIVDMHCDTLTETRLDDPRGLDTLNLEKRVLSFDSMPKDVKWAQFYAVYTPLKRMGEDAWNYYRLNVENFYRQMEKFSGRVAPCRTAGDVEAAWKAGKCAAILTMENGSPLAGRIERVKKIREDGVRVMSLVWNGENEIASGNNTDHGMSAFGREVIPEMEKQGVIADVSHLNDPGFRDLMEVAKKPFVATHSNARAICGHKRNLTDEQIGEMVRRDCLIGLNYYISFLTDKETAGPDDLYRHICRFFELGAEKNLALGSDYDGCTLPDFLKTPELVAQNYDYLLGRGLTEAQVDGIYWKNALEFFRKNL